MFKNRIEGVRKDYLRIEYINSSITCTSTHTHTYTYTS